MFYVCLCIYGVLKSKIIDCEIKNPTLTHIDMACESQSIRKQNENTKNHVL